MPRMEAGLKDVSPLPKSSLEMLAPLFTLRHLKAGFLPYYTALLQEADDVLAVGAACALLDAANIPPMIIPRLLELGKFEAVRQRAFDLFLKNFEFDIAASFSKVHLRPMGDLGQRTMDATLTLDHAALTAVQIDRYLESGNAEDLSKASNAANEEGGWKKSLPLMLKLVILNPQDGDWLLQLCRLLDDANQYELLQRLCEVLETSDVFPVISTIARAMLARNEKAYDHGLKLLDQLKSKSLPRLAEINICRLRADFLDGAGKSQEAYSWYVRLQKFHISKNPDRNFYFSNIKKNAAVAVPQLPKDDHIRDFIMLGFPRSGTTLLENALASHPQIETFEEVPAFASVVHLLSKHVEKDSSLSAELCIGARDRYYRELERRKGKAGAEIFIDKLPILSGQGIFLKKLFPEKKYIFSIRHPYDVVLSCFKQFFDSNPAMDNLTTFEGACRTYNFVMTHWFSAFGLDSEQVCYVRYDDLVADMRKEVTRVLDFVGADWDEGILQFDRRAQERAGKTPSYAKVRKGLSIGRQSAWENYKFLFRKPEARQLDAWVKFFGYPGL